MFALSAKRLFYACDNFLIRSFITGTKLEYPRGNPGIENRLKAFRQDGIKIREDNVEEYIEESESSFYNVDDTYDQHLNETLMGKHELRGHIVKEKYFKENMPNLLTWSEKEQIRHLASTQPQEWTPQKLAESFPVTENVVKKLLKYPWKPATEQRIARHDASAMRNWKELKEGTLDIPESLRQHFLKFSERTIPPLNRKSIKLDISQETIGEFEEIVKRENNNEKAASNNIDHDSGESNTTKNEKPNIKSDFRRVTLDELANKIKSRLDQGLNVDVPDRIIADSLTTYEKSDNTQDNSKEVELVQTTSKDNQLTQFKENDKDVIGVNYPERIRIPKKAFKKGATYKMNDCFYDDDGRFLYRVIGMSNNKN
ncbi:neugrin [Melitaea cinxia]|uniref:neugrin n=1 Tax=Melitaea cinxia TaxID=113334 RepID=UPI001E2704E7|nr:neugrin [Melitaea cinxia]